MSHYKCGHSNFHCDLIFSQPPILQFSVFTHNKSLCTWPLLGTRMLSVTRSTGRVTRRRGGVFVASPSESDTTTTASVPPLLSGIWPSNSSSQFCKSKSLRMFGHGKQTMFGHGKQTNYSMTSVLAFVYRHRFFISIIWII